MGDHDPKPIVIGAGVAGMSAAMRLLDYGIQPLLIDGGSFPKHKVCGEFFSPECLPLLEKWEMAPKMPISRVQLHVKGESYPFELPQPARSESHFHFDFRFLKAVEKKGAVVKTGVEVAQILPDRVILGSGEEHRFSSLFLGTGRFSNKPEHFPYIGMKTEIPLEIDSCLQMHLNAGGYYGVSQVAENVVNVAYLSLAHAAKPPFKGEWMRVKVPPFGAVKHSPLPNVYRIGDAQARIPPCSGEGLAMGITGGVLAADMAAQGRWSDYDAEWKKRYKKRIQWALAIHQLMIRPSLASFALKTLGRFPSTFRCLYMKMR